MRRAVALRFVIGAVIALPVTTGCSALVSRPPPARPLDSPRECSNNRGPVAVDVSVAANAGAAALLFLGAAAIEDAHNQSAVVPSWDTHPLTVDGSIWVGAAISLGITAALIGSAHYGLESARACDAARLDLIERSPSGQWPPGTVIDGVPLGSDGRPLPKPARGPWPSR